MLFSSHILGDVQRVCDTVGVLRGGSLLYQGPLAELLTGRATPAYVVRVRDGIDRVATALRAAPWVVSVERSEAPGELRVGVRSVEDAERGLSAALASADARITSMEPEAADLEQVFLELTS